MMMMMMIIIIIIPIIIIIYIKHIYQKYFINKNVLVLCILVVLFLASDETTG